jgi:hypothetical protein
MEPLIRRISPRNHERPDPGADRRSWRRAIVAACAVLCSIGVMTVVPASMAAAATTDITSAGPLTDIGISTDLDCSVNHTGDSAGEWFGDTACGTFLASGGTLYGPAYVPAGGSASPLTPWTAVSQTATHWIGDDLGPVQDRDRRRGRNDRSAGHRD